MFFIFLFLGVFSGYFAGFLGIGAGVFLMPIFMLMHLNYPVAVDASLMAVFLSSVTASIQNYRATGFSLEAVLFMGIPAAIFAVIGNLYLIAVIPTRALMLIFSGLMLLNVDLLRYLSRKKPKAERAKSKKHLKTYIFAGIISGLSASLLGIGGGILIVTLLCVFSKYKIKSAVRLSVVIMVFTTFFSLVSESIRHILPYSIGVPVALGAVVGGFFGTLSIPYIKQQTILKSNYIISFVLGILMIYNVIMV